MRKDCWMRGDGPLVPFGGVFRAELAEAGHPLGSREALPAVDEPTQSLAGHGGSGD